MTLSGTVHEDIDQAVEILRGGGLIAFPTETYYGLAVDPFSESALKRLFTIKNRPAIKPVLLLIPSRDHLARLTSNVPDEAEILMDRFWPGPLTVVLSARKELSEMLTGGTGTVGVRISPHPLTHALMQAFDGPLTATSANRSGGKPAVSGEEVIDIFGDEIDMLLDGGRTPGQKPSTLVGFSEDAVECIREGCISSDAIQSALQHDV